MNETKYYEYRHVVGFEETNLVGNVYYANYTRWQGRCREMFLFENAPSVLKEIEKDLKLFTIQVNCTFFSEITAFDTVSIRMRLEELGQSQVALAFDYVKCESDGTETLIARGDQLIACMRGDNKKTEPVRVPTQLVDALKPYSVSTGSGSLS